MGGRPNETARVMRPGGAEWANQRSGRLYINAQLTRLVNSPAGQIMLGETVVVAAGLGWPNGAGGGHPQPLHASRSPDPHMCALTGNTP